MITVMSALCQRPRDDNLFLDMQYVCDASACFAWRYVDLGAGESCCVCCKACQIAHSCVEEVAAYMFKGRVISWQGAFG